MESWHRRSIVFKCSPRFGGGDVRSSIARVPHRIVATMTLDCTITTVTLVHILAMTMENIVAFDKIVAFFIRLVSLLNSSPVVWRKEDMEL